jgi:hypothetical protein
MAKTFQWIAGHPNFIKGLGKSYVNCNGCGKTKLVSRAKLRSKVKIGHKSFYCSRVCSYSGSGKSQIKYVLVNGKRKRESKCLLCKKTIFVSQQVKQSGSGFCNAKCRTQHHVAKNELGQMFGVVIEGVLLEMLKQEEDEKIMKELEKMETEHT